MARKINDYLGSHFPAEVLNAANQQAAGYYDILPSRAEMMNQQMTHMPQQTPYQQFQQAYPQLDQYGRDVVTGQVAKRGLLDLADNLNKAYTDPSALQDYIGFGGMTAFHGSPHKFSKFMMDKIGTGEGAQAYGHGLYFAESPGVAKSYQMKLVDDNPNISYFIDGNKVENPSESMAEALEFVQSNNNNIDNAIDNARRIKQRGANIDIAAIERDINSLRGKSVGAWEDTQGHFYEVDIPDTQINKMLDWDAIDWQQPKHVKEFAKNLDLPSEYAGNDILHAARKKYGEVGASEEMRKAGIPGIKYLDQGSRTTNEGTRNFVVFDENIVKILNRK